MHDDDASDYRHKAMSFCYNLLLRFRIFYNFHVKSRNWELCERVQYVYA